MATPQHGELLLTTGKTIYTNANIIGINPQLEISEGYDSTISVVGHYPSKLLLTQAERHELADYVINLWQQFKNLTDEEIIERG